MTAEQWRKIGKANFRRYSTMIARSDAERAEMQLRVRLDNFLRTVSNCPKGDVAEYIEVTRKNQPSLFVILRNGELTISQIRPQGIEV